MSPEQISVITAISAILEKIGTMPVFSLIVIVIVGPWLVMVFISRGQEKRFDAMTEMYKNNVALVKCYEDIAKNMQDLVITNVSTMTTANNIALNNLYCPIVRKRTQQKEVDA